MCSLWLHDALKTVQGCRHTHSPSARSLIVVFINTTPGPHYKPAQAVPEEPIDRQQRAARMQCQKIDEIRDGEAVLKGSRYVPYLRDNNATSFSKGALLWSGARFDNVAQNLTYTEYEAMSRALADTGDWQASKPQRSADQPGTAAFLFAPQTCAKVHTSTFVEHALAACTVCRRAAGHVIARCTSACWRVTRPVQVFCNASASMQ